MKNIILILILLCTIHVIAQDTIHYDSICAAVSSDSTLIISIERNIYYANCSDTSITKRYDYIYYRDSAGIRLFAFPACATDNRINNLMWYIVNNQTVRYKIIRKKEVWLKKP